MLKAYCDRRRCYTWLCNQYRGITVLILSLGLMLFILVHLLRELGLRDTVISKFPSKSAYMGAYALLALIGLILIAWGKSISPFVMIWQPAYELRYISHMIMIPSMILIVAGNVPLSHLRKNLRNPMLLGVTFWAFSHLWSNGDLSSMLLFGGIGLWSLIKFVSLSRTTSFKNGDASIIWDGVSLGVGLFAYWLLILNHGPLFGVGLSLA